MGLLDNPNMAMAMSLLANSGYSRTPRTFGQNLGEAFGARMQAEEAMRKRQMEQQQFDMQQKKAQFEMQDIEGQRAMGEQLGGLLSSGQPIDRNKVAGMMARFYPKEAFNMLGKDEETFSQTPQALMYEGKPVVAIVGNKGTIKPLPGYAPKQDFDPNKPFLPNGQPNTAYQDYEMRKRDGVGAAPTMTEVVDPADPTRMLRVDAKKYRGGSLGSPGVIGISGKEPTAAKKIEKQEAGRESLDKVIAELSSYYDKLDKNFGITSTDNNTIANVGANIASSGIGQMAGKMFGTDNQSARNSIVMTRPLLMRAIMEATGMSAKNLDSNRELQIWLDAATNPQLDVQANRQALENIRNFYGKPQNSPATSTAPGGALKVGTVKRGYIFMGGNPADPKSWKKQ